MLAGHAARLFPREACRTEKSVNPEAVAADGQELPLLSDRFEHVSNARVVACRCAAGGFSANGAVWHMSSWCKAPDLLGRALKSDQRARVRFRRRSGTRRVECSALVSVRAPTE